MHDREDQGQRRGKFRAIGAELPKLARPVLGRRGLGEAQLLLHWTAIAGPELADVAQPDRLRFEKGARTLGTLRLKVAPAAALELQHQAPQIIERINAFLGYAAVARLAYVQAPLRPLARRAPAPRPLREEEQEALARQVAGVDDEALRAALERLGSAIAAARDA